MPDELKPCPFCGGTDIGISTKFGHAECGQCGATGPWSQHDEAFLAAELRHYWCLRPIEDALRAENTRLRGILRDLAGCEDQDLIKGHVVMSTLEVDALRAEVKRLRSSIADHENDCACLPEDRSVTETVTALRAEVASLREVLTEYTCDLTDEQAILAQSGIGFHMTPRMIQTADAAIRRVRGAE